MIRASIALSKVRARRLAVIGQLLSSPRPSSIDEVVRKLGWLQMDPVSAVARTEHLVLFSRLGKGFRVAELERMLWDERSLFEYSAFIVPTADFSVHRESMRRYPNGPRRELASRANVRGWLAANASFRRHVLTRLRDEGPLRTRDFSDGSARGWRSGGWNDVGRNTTMMLEILWTKGEVMIVGRQGLERVWDLASRRLPFDEPRLPARTVARRILDTQLRALGVATSLQFGWAIDGRPPGWERALADLVRDGIVVPVTVEDLPVEWYAHADVLEQRFRGRTVLLSPFDRLIHDRARTEQLFDFRYRLEMYVPKTKREYGYYVLPILQGDRLIGRLDPLFDRKTKVLAINGVWAEADAPADSGRAVRAAIDELAAWLGATDVAFGARTPASWRRALAS
ncbi:MAG: winged helix DNA-binding domain-containing protein [Actinomycetota bacterium]|nr:winged helix DNA-binding domain-containing protein [Actinomycetota bacterium]